MVEPEKIRKAVELLREAAHPRKIILFGSHARGDAREDSDVDFLVIEERLENRREEMARLRHLLSPLRIPVDVLVIAEKDYRERRDWLNTVYYEAHREGKVVYEAA